MFLAAISGTNAFSAMPNNGDDPDVSAAHLMGRLNGDIGDPSTLGDDLEGLSGKASFSCPSCSC